MPVNAFPKFTLLFVMNDKQYAALQKYGAFNPLTGITGIAHCVHFLFHTSSNTTLDMD